MGQTEKKSSGKATFRSTLTAVVLRLLISIRSTPSYSCDSHAPGRSDVPGHIIAPRSLYVGLLQVVGDVVDCTAGLARLGSAAVPSSHVPHSPRHARRIGELAVAEGPSRVPIPAGLQRARATPMVR
jgi:hypothetical protein